MEIISRIIPAKPRNKELYFLKGTGGTVISSSSGSNLGTTTPLYWKLIDTDEFDLPLENPYISTNYPIITKVLPPEPIIDPENPEAPVEPVSKLNYLQIGDARLIYEDNALKAIKENGDPLSFYATGELSAYVLNGNENPENPDSTLFSIANATDVILTNTSTDDLLKYNGTKWVNVPMSSLGTGGTEYILPTASDTTLGGIKVGNGLTISSGVLSVVGGGGSVTSVGISVPTGLSVSNSPITSSGVIAIGLQTGYSIPTTAKQGQWDTAYTHSQSEHQSIINGTGFVKANGKTLSYDNSSYSLSSHNHSGVYQPLHTGLTNIATQSASATTGLLRKTAANTWTFDTNTYSLSNHTHTFTSLTSKPTTLSGYGITDAAPKSHSDISGESTIHHTHSNKTVIDGITSTNITNWGTAYTNSHTHSNKTTIDGITSTRVNNWDSAFTDKHTHTNKTVIDGITSTLVSNWNTAYTNNHTHSNKSNLDTINQAMATTNAVTFASLTALTSVRTNKADFGNTWTLEPSGTEVQLKYGGATKMRFLSDGSIAAMGELTAYASATTGGTSDFLSTITGGTVAGKVGLLGTSYPNLYGNGSLLVLGKGNSTTDSIAISAGSLRYYGSSMALGSSTNMWNNTYTDKITLGNGWTIEHSSTALTIRKDGVIKGTFNA